MGGCGFSQEIRNCGKHKSVGCLNSTHTRKKVNIMPRVSVLMPAYNSEKYIAEAIESILSQTFTDFEFIIINDGSTDGTSKIVRKYATRDPRIKFIDNKQNRGLIAVLNQGLDLCTGEYIARMDSDDISRPERFKLQVDYMDTHPNVGVVGAWVRLFGALDDVYQYRRTVKLFDMLIYGANIAHPTAMIRTSVLRNNKIYYDPKYPHAEDYGFWVSIVRVSEIHNLQTVLLDYRWHDTNVSVLHHKTQMESAERVRHDLLETVLTNDKDVKKLLNLTRELHQHFWLFGFLPIVRCKQYSITKTKYYLFEKIPLLRIQDGKIYLFEFIKIGNLR